MKRRDLFGMRKCATGLAGFFVLTVSLLAGSAGGDVAPDPDSWGTDEEFVDPTQTCQGDVVPNGVVDVADLVVVLASWGDCPGCPGDASGDGVVDVEDLLLVMSWWGPCE
jgi:hypothetical protein